ncbi:MAG: DoxX family protein [Planctomycetota bacterium]|jgi:uncharacterized membrane protein YphA (DoxX/SURF4 family)
MDKKKTAEDKLTRGVRLLLALMFVMTGAMKLFVPSLRDAFAGQLEAAHPPLQSLARSVVPYAEIALGVLLALGVVTRLAAAGIIFLMAGATYIHVVVHDPSLFPLQPSQPIIPVVVIAMCLFLLWRNR